MLRGRAGSLISFLFRAFNCTCSASDGTAGEGTPAPRKRSVAARARGSKPGGVKRCPSCGLKLPEGENSPAIAAFPGQGMRCKCPPKSALSEDEMAKMFWQLKQTGAGSTFSSQSSVPRKKGRTSVDLIEGAIIGGTYKIEGLIGAGGMGEVYKAQHLMLKKTCALKVIPPDQVTQIGWQRFQAEAKTIAKLSHINLVKVSDLGVHEGCLPYYAMEFIDGETLFHLLRGRGPLPLTKVLPIFSQICDGLAYAHRNGLVHRDLKPENIMLERSAGGKVTVKILDFGLVKLAQNDRAMQSLTAVGEVFGSPFYMSPEQCVGGQIDNRTDIYSAGCMLFECLTGRPPFVDPSPVELITSHQSAEPPTLADRLGKNALPQSMDVVLAKLLRKDPLERYQSFSELKSDLIKVGRGETVEPFIVSRATRTAKSSGRAETTSQAEDDATGSFDRPLHIRNILIVSGIALTLLIGAAAFVYYLPKVRLAETKPPAAEPLERGEAAAVIYNATDDFDLVKPAKPERPIQSDRETKVEANLSSSLSQERNSPMPTVAASEIIGSGPFSGIVVESNGKKCRFLRFPKQSSLGRLKFGNGNIAFAHGTVLIPIDAAVTFSPSVELMKYPDYLKHFQPGDIIEVKLSPNPDGDNNALLAACSRLRGVKRLDLISANDLNSYSIPIIDRFESLESLRVVVENETAEALARLSALKKVGNLSLLGDTLDPIIFRIRDASSIKSLSLRTITFTNRSIDLLANMPHLEYLYLDSDSLNHPAVVDYVLAKLVKSPRLKTLGLGRAGISDNGIASLKKFPSLQMIQIGQPKLDEKLRQYLAQKLPGLEFSPVPPQ